MDEEAERLKKQSRDGLVYLTTCMIGHLVEAHLKDGSVYSGIFHAADVDKDFGIILKRASLIKDGTLEGQESGSEVVRKPTTKKLVYIPADELVQVVAKDLSVSSDGMLNAVQSEKSVELLTDSSISKSCHVGQGRELKPWVPDEEAPEGLDDVFDESLKRGWDQFKVNEELFGVTSTFNEEMYTTTLDRGSRTRELEEKAMSVAKEIEDENTGDLHVAEERGLQVNEKVDTDEEAKYSAVRPVDGFDEDEKLLDTCNDQTSSGSSTSNVQNPASSSGQKPTSSGGKGYEVWLTSFLKGERQFVQNETNVDQSCSLSDNAGHIPSEQKSKDFLAQGSSISESQLGERRNNNNPEVAHSNRSPEASVSGHGDVQGVGTSGSKTVAEKESQVSQVSGETKSKSSFGQSDSRRSSESGPSPSMSTRPGLSPSSSVSSLSTSEKSTLNPNAKVYFLLLLEFKPSQPPAPVRPQSPIANASFNYPAPRAPVQLMPRMPASYGIQPLYPVQPQLLRYPGHDYPQTYYPPNAPPWV
ncbi:unnamed protein product [Eruca vesicaria subsp. sativa]|uniref:LsmAD domain-containing protein n=1 Tax=Eruca vesicaria subsp. sativa TaxID=29727 RepID=A0ABC8L5M6_ERUVS|nr:unnamed protein product [Eruca vesicaria subsp. sativa]